MKTTTETTTRVWKKEEIVALLETNNGFLCRSVVKIWNRQTTDEKICKGTSHENGRGFNGTDANILSSFAEYYVTKGYLTKNQLELARKKMKKYAKQLTIVANELEATKQPKAPNVQLGVNPETVKTIYWTENA
jgi:hypothetical protein